MCPKVGDSDAQADAWLAVFAPPITAALNTGAPGANLTDADVYNLISLCAFDTVAHEKRGAFCDLFTGTHPIAGKVALKMPRGRSYTDTLMMVSL